MSAHTEFSAPSSDQERSINDLHSGTPFDVSVSMLPNGDCKVRLGTLGGTDPDNPHFAPADDCATVIRPDGSMTTMYIGQVEYYEALLGLDALSNVQIRLSGTVLGMGAVARGPVTFACYRPYQEPMWEQAGEERIANIMINPSGTVASAWDPTHIVETLAATKEA